MRVVNVAYHSFLRLVSLSDFRKLEIGMGLYPNDAAKQFKDGAISKNKCESDLAYDE
jgi:hypothetical protein